jgi:hypothetical protein
LVVVVSRTTKIEIEATIVPSVCGGDRARFCVSLHRCGARGGRRDYRSGVALSKPVNDSVERPSPAERRAVT